MPRGARIGYSAQIYHVITRGNNRQWVFQEDEDFRNFDRYADDLVPGDKDLYLQAVKL